MRAFYSTYRGSGPSKILLPEGVHEVGVLTDDGREFKLLSRELVDEEEVVLFTESHLVLRPTSSNWVKLDTRPGRRGLNAFATVPPANESEMLLRKIHEAVSQMRAAGRRSKAALARQTPVFLADMKRLGV